MFSPVGLSSPFSTGPLLLFCPVALVPAIRTEDALFSKIKDHT